MAAKTRTRSKASDEESKLLVRPDCIDGDALPIGNVRSSFEVAGDPDTLPDEFFDALARLLLAAADSERIQRTVEEKTP